MKKSDKVKRGATVAAKTLGDDGRGGFAVPESPGGGNNQKQASRQHPGEANKRKGLIGRIKGLLKLKIALAVTGVAVLCGLFVFSYFFESHSTSREYFGVSNRQMTEMLKMKFDDLMKQVDGYAQLLSGYKQMTDEELSAILEAVITVTRFNDAALLDETATGRFASGNTMWLADRPYYVRGMLGEHVITEVMRSRITDESINAFSAPVYGSDGTVVGVFACLLPLDSMSELLETNVYDGRMSNYILLSSGMIAAASPNGLTESTQKGTGILDVVKPRGITNDELQAQFVKGKSSEGYFYCVYGSEEYLAAYSSVGVSNWMVLSMVPNSSLREPFLLTDIIVPTFALLIAGLCTALMFVLMNVQRKTGAIIDGMHKQADDLINSDPLTGCDSFLRFSRKIQRVLENPEAGERYALVSLDIMKFRTVNDLLGHDGGDEVLRQLAELLRQNLQPDEFITRMYASSFYITMHYKDESELIHRIEDIINDTYYQITQARTALAIGIYKIDDLTLKLRTMLDHADLAHKTASRGTESAYAFFDSRMLSKIREEKGIEDVMEQALEGREFKVFLQPKFHLRDRRRVVGAEALIRWQRDGKLISPGSFVPLFEKNGFIKEIDHYVFEEVCKLQKFWLERALEQVNKRGAKVAGISFIESSIPIISVNMSRVNMQLPSFVQDLVDICDKYELPTKYIEIEITESVAFDDSDTLTRVFRELKENGFSVSIDDFGTGYSSLSMLKDLPIDVLKIDRAFLTDSGKNKRAAQIIGAVIQLSMQLGIHTICEGLETLEQADLLTSLGCDMAQGFYFARPMPVPDYEALLQKSLHLEPADN
jgi:diguanylate cyclase (GGDEF)-like protein